MNHNSLKFIFPLIIISIIFNITHANPTQPIFNSTNHSWKAPAPNSTPNPNFRSLIAGILSFIAAAISSAGGIGGGGLFIPILTIVAALDLKTASSYSAFMVTGGSMANVGCHLLAKSSKPLIDYDITLLSEPCILLGVSIGVICNQVFPEWLITIFFVVFLAFCTFKTCRSGVFYWTLETEEAVRRNGGCGGVENGCGGGESTKVPLLSGVVEEGKVGIPWRKIGLLVVIWLSFFVLYLLRGNRYGQGVIQIKPCGTAYWIISSIQIPLAIIFTAGILYGRKGSIQQDDRGGVGSDLSGNITFSIMALLAGVLGGVFGIGGGMLISPLLLQIGIAPEVAAATCSFMVLFSSTMSAIQYVLLGMEHIYGAVNYALICFVGSLVGLTLVQKAIMKHGRASLIVFSVGTVMALSTVLLTSFGGADVWRDYTSGKSMGFKELC